ncbi:MAG: hypothetical protein LBL86_08155 [Coriobacteriales bacterium]|nr:hypothetical protein [Coriobacteriales bacterium]
MRVVMERNPTAGNRQAASGAGAAGGDVASAVAAAGGAAGTASPGSTASAAPGITSDAHLAAADLLTVSAPLVGIVYRSREPDGVPFVECGQRVAKGDVLCLIEAMKLFNEITAPTAGTVDSILFEDGMLAEYGAALVTLRPDPSGGPGSAAGTAGTGTPTTPSSPASTTPLAPAPPAQGSAPSPTPASAS